MPSIARGRNIGVLVSKLLAFDGQRKGIPGLAAVAAAGQAATRVPAAFNAALSAVGDLGQAMATRGRARGAGGEGVIAGVLLERVLDLRALAALSQQKISFISKS